MVGPTPVDYSISDEDFAVFTEAFTLKIQEEGLNNDAEGMNYVMQEWWGLLTDPVLAQRYIDSQNLEKLKAVRDGQDTGRPAMDAEIARLEAATRTR